MPFLDSLKGYRTKIASIALAVLAANEAWHFIPPQYVNLVMYLASAGGLYFLRDALDRLKNQVDPTPAKS